MYYNIYKSLIDILTKRGEEGYERLDNTKDITKILSVNLPFDPHEIFAVDEVEIDNMSNILFVFANSPTGPKGFYTEYLFYKGKIVKLILINALAMIGHDEVLKYRTLMLILRESCIHILKYYQAIIETDPERTYALAVVGVYASSVLMVKTADKFFNYENMNDEEKNIHNYMILMNIYQSNNINVDMISKYPELNPETTQTVPSIRKAINQVGIDMLLDNSLWISTSNPELYPGCRFLDARIKNESIETEENE